MDPKKTTFSLANLAITPLPKKTPQKSSRRPSAISLPTADAPFGTPPVAALKKQEEERVKVYVRVRPTHAHETSRALTLKPNNTGLFIHREGSYTSEFAFDGVLGPSATQADVYEVAAKPAVADVLRGYNATLMAYGQTGAGKTHTLGSIQPDAVGIIPRALGEIFDSITADVAHAYTITLSYLQIYCEQLQDLLCPDAGDNLAIREGPGGVYVPDLKQVEVTSLEECLQLLQLGARNRTVAFTALNAHSSRSHAVVIATVVRRPVVALPEKGAKVQVGKLFMVDLAGSERLKKSRSTGQRASEAKAINLSLTTLGMCVSARASGTASHIPFRDSKLTRLLQESLGGNARTSLVVAICDAQEHAEETFQSLQFGSRAMRVATQAKINEHTDSEMNDETGVPGPCSPLTERTSTLVQSLLEKESQLEAVQAQLRSHQQHSRQVVEALKAEHAEMAVRAEALAARHEAAQAQHEALHRAVQEAEQRAAIAENKLLEEREALLQEVAKWKAEHREVAARAATLAVQNETLHAERDVLRQAAAKAEERAAEVESRCIEEKKAMEEEVVSLKADALRNAKEAEAAHQLLESERIAMQTKLEEQQIVVDRALEDKATIRAQTTAIHAAEIEEMRQKWEIERARLQEEHAREMDAAKRTQQQVVAAAEASRVEQTARYDAEIGELQHQWELERSSLQDYHETQLATAVEKEAEKTEAARHKCHALRQQLEAALAGTAAERQAAAAKLSEVEFETAKERHAAFEKMELLRKEHKTELSVKEAEAVEFRATVHQGQLELAQVRSVAAQLEKQVQERDEHIAKMHGRVGSLEEQLIAARHAIAAAEARVEDSERSRAKLLASLQRDKRFNNAATVIQRAFRAYRVRTLQMERSEGYAALSEAHMALGTLTQQHAELEARRHSNLALTGQTLVAESLETMQDMVETLIAEFLLPSKDLKAVQRLRAKATGPAPSVAGRDQITRISHMGGGGGGPSAPGVDLIGAFRAPQERPSSALSQSYYQQYCEPGAAMHESLQRKKSSSRYG